MDLEFARYSAALPQLRVGMVIDKYKMAKHFELTITDDRFHYQRKTRNIENEAALDGIYVIRTDVPRETRSAEDTVRSYKGLSVVQLAQRSPKALKKTRTKRTEDGLPVHSFQTLLQDLPTLVIDRVQPKPPELPAFDKLTTPTPP